MLKDIHIGYCVKKFMEKKQKTNTTKNNNKTLETETKHEATLFNKFHLNMNTQPASLNISRSIYKCITTDSEHKVFCWQNCKSFYLSLN